MLSRKEHEEAGSQLPGEWSEGIKQLLDSTYKDQCSTYDKSFQVFGISYPDELLITVSLDDNSITNNAPFTYMASAELNTSTDVKKLLDALVDSIGQFFDHFFNTYPEQSYQANWEKAEFRGFEFYYKLSRENVGLYLQADELLRQK